MIVSFVVDGPPVPKARARVVNGHSYTPKRTEQYENHVALIARAAVSRVSRWNRVGPHALHVRVFRAARRGDLDNFVKAISDSCNGVVWDDDKSVVEIHAHLADDKARPRVEVEVHDMGEDAERVRVWDEVLP